MKRAATALALFPCLLALGGCSGSEGLLPTGSIFGGGSAPAPALAAPAVPAAPPSDPTSRAFQVGAVSARALKCGYNFDTAKLKAAYLASETALGSSPEDLAKIEKIYSVASNGVTKAIATQPNYCSAAKTKEIKADLTRVLAGDYAPQPRKPVVEEDDGGLFSSLTGGGGSSDKGLDIKPSTANGF